MAEAARKDQIAILETTVLGALGLDSAGEIQILDGTTDKDAFVVNTTHGRLIITSLPAQEGKNKELIWGLLEEIAASSFIDIKLGGIPEFKAIVNDKLWMAYKYICPQADRAFDWRKRTWSLRHVRSAARVLADFHRAGAVVLARSPVSGVVVDSLAAASWCLQTINHGDFHPGNLLFVKGTAAALLDFAYAHIGNSMFDLGYGALMFAADWSAAEAESVVNTHLASQFARSYCLQRAVDFSGGKGGGKSGGKDDAQKLEKMENKVIDTAALSMAMKDACSYVIAWADTTGNIDIARAGYRALKELARI